MLLRAFGVMLTAISTAKEVVIEVLAMPTNDTIAGHYQYGICSLKTNYLGCPDKPDIEAVL